MGTNSYVVSTPVNVSCVGHHTKIFKVPHSENPAFNIVYMSICQSDQRLIVSEWISE